MLWPGDASSMIGGDDAAVALPRRITAAVAAAANAFKIIAFPPTFLGLRLFASRLTYNFKLIKIRIRIKIRKNGDFS